MKAIRTRYRGVSRTYVATDGDGNRVVIPEPDRTANTQDAHRAAAMALIRRMDWAPVVIASGWSHAGEFVHVMLPPMREADRLELARASNRALYPVEAL